MSDYFAKICHNGHVLVDRSALVGKEYCEKCGQLMISACPNCHSTIKTWHYDASYIGRTPKYEKPLYCKRCGIPYPWTKTALETTASLIQEDNQLSDLEKNAIENSLPDIVTETPKTKTATIRIKKALCTAGDFTTDALRQFVIDFGCELAKSFLGF